METRTLYAVPQETDLETVEVTLPRGVDRTTAGLLMLAGVANGVARWYTTRELLRVGVRLAPTVFFGVAGVLCVLVGLSRL